MTKRKLRRKSCTGKIRYESFNDANKHAVSMHYKTGQWFAAYHCKFCGGWHIGHPPYSVRQSIIDQKKNRRKEFDYDETNNGGRQGSHQEKEAV
jgi:hypothetical protein